ncbi:flavodoxin family protein [Undibacterium squillarum]|uniref:Flavoprotein WrbA n=1 Tax=Undibacterium squillarum TaxID=1131567 RepID=A0ABQ2XYJ9_9BURK|nr:flavodoxin family protein [Undibacterium squillarum]GGX43405.1 tryptophan repressor binding protein [Undibacterium squillarum]
MKKVAIVFHSGYGHTVKAAEAVQAGVIAGQAEAHLVAIGAEGTLTDEQWATLNTADAIVFGSPTYMGMASWQFKKFADATSRIWFTQGWKNKLAAGFTNSATMNGDKASTINYLFTLAQQHGMLWVGTGLLPSNSKAAQRNDINYIGASAGLMTVSPSDSTPEEGPLPGDLETAKLFGQRIAETAARLLPA